MYKCQPDRCTDCAKPRASWATAGRCHLSLDTTVGHDKVVVRIYLARLSAGLRGGAGLPRGTIHIGLALIVASLIRCAYQRCLAIAGVRAMRLHRKLTHHRLVAGNDAALSCWAVSRNVADVVTPAHGAHQRRVAVAVDYACSADFNLAPAGIPGTQTDTEIGSTGQPAAPSEPLAPPTGPGRLLFGSTSLGSAQVCVVVQICPKGQSTLTWH